MGKTGKTSGTGPLMSSATPTGQTHQGGTGYGREDHTELYLRATTMFAGEKSFYENASVHDARSIELARKLAVSDWGWMSLFLPWLRKSANIRTMAIMLAAEAVDARIKAGITGTRSTPENKAANGLPIGPGIDITDLPSNRQIISEVIQRPDEPAEMLQYWIASHGKPIPKPIKRGVADAASRMYTQRNTLRYDGKGPMEFADVTELTRPKLRTCSVPLFGPDGAETGVMLAKDPEQGMLYRHLITNRKNRDGYEPPVALEKIRARHDLSRAVPSVRHHVAGQALAHDPAAELIIRNAAAGQWEWVMSWLGETCPGALSKREQWELVIPDMGYMALLRNLRNFDEAGIKQPTINKIIAKLTNPAEVQNSRQLPFRFLSAYKAAPSLKWGQALEDALQLCVPNIPMLPGKTLILIDTSGSMDTPMSAGGPRQDMSMRPTRLEAGALFGVALGLRNPGNTDVWAFADGQMKIENITQGKSILKTVEMITYTCGKVGHGTQIERAVHDTYKDHDRVCIFTDMQTMESSYSMIGNVSSAVPDDVHVYGFNLAGYGNSAMPSKPFRHELGGLSDHTFGLIPLLESGAKGDWPWNA